MTLLLSSMWLNFRPFPSIWRNFTSSVTDSEIHQKFSNSARGRVYLVTSWWIFTSLNPSYLFSRAGRVDGCISWPGGGWVGEKIEENSSTDLKICDGNLTGGAFSYIIHSWKRRVYRYNGVISPFLQPWASFFPTFPTEERHLFFLGWSDFIIEVWVL